MGFNPGSTMIDNFDGLFAKRMGDVQKSFIREILKVAANPEIISFAGGLPNPELFPVQAIQEACDEILRLEGRSVLQYSTTEGFPPLREKIAADYRQQYGLKVSADDILITNGSQQGLDLISKVLIDPGDKVLVESPGYLGALQAMSLYQPDFRTLPLTQTGPDPEKLAAVLGESIKMFYTVPNFQNPSGITYSREARKQVAEAVKPTNTILVEDNPYGALRFMGEDLPPMKSDLGNQSLLLGSFSKTVVPSFRLGWICAEGPVMEKLIIAKQGADLHTNYFCQRVVHYFMTGPYIDEHYQAIKAAYKAQRDAMVSMIEQYFPPEVEITRPEGGMFIWAILPESMSAMELFDKVIEKKVAFVPGFPFYVDGGGKNTMRLNYSNSNPDKIEKGIKIIGESIREMMK